MEEEQFIVALLQTKLDKFRNEYVEELTHAGIYAHFAVFTVKDLVAKFIEAAPLWELIEKRDEASLIEMLSLSDDETVPAVLNTWKSLDYAKKDRVWAYANFFLHGVQDLTK